MMLIFFDTEFTDLHRDALLISIGLVSEDGRTFYAELTDGDPWHYVNASDFAKVEVLPLLEGDCRMSMAELSTRLAAWLADFARPVQLATDSLAWDWQWIQRLYWTPGSWPANLEHHPLLLTMNYLNDFDAFENGLTEAFASGLRRHHALDDAKANRLAWMTAGGDCDHPFDATKRERLTKDGGAVDADAPTVRVMMVDERLTATLPDGANLVVDTDHSRDLADALFARGFDSEHVHCVDWRESGSIGVGHCIAIKSRLRELEKCPFALGFYSPQTTGR